MVFMFIIAVYIAMANGVIVPTNLLICVWLLAAMKFIVCIVDIVTANIKRK